MAVAVTPPSGAPTERSDGQRASSGRPVAPSAAPTKEATAGVRCRPAGVDGRAGRVPWRHLQQPPHTRESRRWAASSRDTQSAAPTKEATGHRDGAAERSAGKPALAWNAAGARTPTRLERRPGHNGLGVAGGACADAQPMNVLEPRRCRRRCGTSAGQSLRWPSRGTTATRNEIPPAQRRRAWPAPPAASPVRSPMTGGASGRP